ncbi:MAG TPA: hypothetical protein VJS66_04915, partial [Burkholderiales bacterium]|nr:hypothetical protein [Burkholderiales bacterium]
MRRWLFAAFVLANLGLLLWGIQYVEPERPVQAQVYEEINSDKMRLLSEVPQGKLVPRPKPAPPLPSPAVDGQICYRIGPLVGAAQAKTIEESPQAQSLAFARREDNSTTVTAYRVFLPPFASKAQAEQKRRELTRLGFSDHAVMQDDGLRNAISLGIFSVEANARSRLQSLLEKGVVATIEPVEQLRTVYWLELRPAASDTDLLARLRSLLEGVAGAAVVDFPCPAPAVP